MTPGPRLTVSWAALAAAALALIAAGAASAYLVMRGPGEPPPGGRESANAVPGTPEHASHGPAASGGAPDSAQAAAEDIVVTLTEEAIDRAGISVAPVTAGEMDTRLRIPGVVEPNAYKQVVVTPLVAGRVMRVSVVLGDRVQRGQTLAEVYSPELADAQREYLSFMAELEAAHHQLRRTERLVEIGAASRQELERVRAEHTAHETHFEGARSRLVLLGMTAPEISRLASGTGITALTRVPAPIAGVVVDRQANQGLNVDSGMPLFTVVELSTVWVVGDVYERDLERVRVGSPATITTAAYPDLTVQGRVSYIDPRLAPETRTARVRVEVGNPGGRLKLGMYVDLEIAGTGPAAAALVPRSAIQSIADRQVVYLVDAAERGRFTERTVRLGRAAGDRVEVLSGLKAGDLVVTEGSFYVRAERERLGLGRQSARVPAGARSSSAAAESGPAAVQNARIVVSEAGYEPASIALRAGVPARLTFVRTTDATCGTEVVFPAENITRDLPLNQPVVVEFTPGTAGEIAFTCGMDMLRGTLVVQ